jgi:hypothetical protein
MLSRGEDYRELGADHFDRQNKPKVVNRLVKRLTQLGYYVTLQESADTAASITLLPVAVGGTGSPTAPPVQAAGDPAAPTLFEPASQTPQAISKRAPGRPCKCASRGLPCHHKNSASTLRPNNSSA